MPKYKKYSQKKLKQIEALDFQSIFGNKKLNLSSADIIDQLCELYRIIWSDSKVQFQIHPDNPKLELFKYSMQTFIDRYHNSEDLKWGVGASIIYILHDLGRIDNPNPFFNGYEIPD
jgi:hypothetical protein